MDGRSILRRASALSLTTLCMLALPVMAGTDSWSVAGSPSGGYVLKVIVDPSTPSTLYALSNPGVFKSTDSGATWSLVFPTVNAPDSMELDPLAPDTLYVGYNDGDKTLFKSTDGGASWSEADEGIGTTPDGGGLDWLAAIAADPVHEGTLYAAGGNTGVYKSTDGGLHWQASDHGISNLVFPDSIPDQIFVDPAAANVVYLNQTVFQTVGQPDRTHLAGLYKSVDGGGHWSASGLTGQNLYHVAMDPADHTHLIACTSGLALMSSPDSGVTWSNIGACPFSPFMAFDPSDSLRLFFGTYGSPYADASLSPDGGATSAPMAGLGYLRVWNYAFDPSAPANVYAATGFGVFKSTDGGANWSQSTTGIHNVTVNQMLEGPDEQLYLASDSTGIFKSLDQGVTWNQVGGGVTGSLPMTAMSVMALVEDPKVNSTLYAGTTGGIYMTIDGGDTWTETDTGVPNSGYTLALAMDPQVPATLYAATNIDGAGIYKSVDGGASWAASGTGITISPDGGTLAVTVDPQHSDVVYAGAFETGLFKSTDGGAHWASANSGLGSSPSVWAIAVDPVDSQVIYASTDDGFFKSTDGAATWLESDQGLDGFLMSNIHVDPQDTSLIYVTPLYGIGDAYVSSDAGATWTAMSAGITASAHSAQTRALHTSGEGGAPKSVVPFIPVTINFVVMDPKHHTRVLGSGSDGVIYAYDDQHPPTTNSSSSGGIGGGTSKPPKPAASSGGGGGFPLLAGLALFGLGLLRRRR